MKYFNKCCKSGHVFDECQERKIICPFCGGDHKDADCKQFSDPKCLNCDGHHPAFSQKCLERNRAPGNPQPSAPILPIETPPAQEPPNMMRALKEYALMFLNIHPTNRDFVLHLNEQITKHMFGWTCVTIPSPVGFQLHFKPITPSTI
ncbi:hypothetical protein JTB14_009995 [Gonioctena quinquepunctata]|nr:hypothetical protein JTB14_009995 [Gonioctena quinquepunctata]